MAEKVSRVLMTNARSWFEGVTRLEQPTGRVRPVRGVAPAARTTPVEIVTAPRSTPRASGLWSRILSAAFLIPIIVVLVFFGGWYAFGGAVAALVLGSLELHAMFGKKGWRPLTALSVIFGIELQIAAMLYLQTHDTHVALVLLGLGITSLLVIAFAWLMFARKTLEGGLVDWALTIATSFYLGWPLLFFLLLRGTTFGAGSVGFWWLLALFFMVWANDSFALFTGRAWGRHKLLPLISPAKTWEGFVGGLVFSVVAALVFTVLLPLLFQHVALVAWYHAVILGVLVAIAATVGDLAESLVKRATGVKDSGNLVPGHGGLLDRMDSLLFAVLIVFFYAAFLHSIVL